MPRWIAGRGALSKEKMTTMKHENKMIYRVTLTAVFAALVFVSSMLSVPIPVAIGDVTRIHLGNIFCLLSGFVLGPVGGGLAAGLGSALYDMTNPAYIASAPFTFVFKFLLAAVCGWAAYARGSRAENHGQNILAAIAGAVLGQELYRGYAAGQRPGPRASFRGYQGGYVQCQRCYRRGGFRALVRGHPAGAEKEPSAGKAGLKPF